MNLLIYCCLSLNKLLQNKNNQKINWVFYLCYIFLLSWSTQRFPKFLLGFELVLQTITKVSHYPPRTKPAITSLNIHDENQSNIVYLPYWELYTFDILFYISINNDFIFVISWEFLLSIPDSFIDYILSD